MRVGYNRSLSRDTLEWTLYTRIDVMCRKRRKVALVYLCIGLCVLCLCIRALTQYGFMVKVRAKLRPGEYYVRLGDHDVMKVLRMPEADVADERSLRNITKLGRSLPDTRPSRCLHGPTSSSLPKTSVIIVFHDESRYQLMQTIYSLMLRTPASLLGEIILIDDSSAVAELGSELASLTGVRMVRNSKREGLIRSRNTGAKESEYPVLVFLAGACEVNVGWLEPLLQRIVQSPNSVVCPINDGIHHETLQYSSGESDVKGGFNWDLTFKLEKTQYQNRDSVASPVVVGSMFAVHRHRFLTLGSFDSDMTMEGGELLELSFKSWLCGGTVDIIPCSRVGVLDRNRNANGVHYTQNVRRVAEVWLDDYKRFFYFSKPSSRLTQLQSVLERKSTKHHLQCKAFKWYLDTVYPELRLPVTGELGYGQIKQEGRCLDIEIGHVPPIAKLNACDPDKESQRWQFREEGEISSHGSCLTADGVETYGYVVVHFCNKDRTQKWKIHNQQIYRDGTSECLDSHKSEAGLVISDCDDLYSTQLWQFNAKPRHSKSTLSTLSRDEV